jgi:hypothetical protein
VTVTENEDTFTERLLTGARQLMRWASPAPRSAEGGSSAGCLHPLTLLKFAVIILLVVFLPVYMLPLMLVRLVIFGRSAARYSSVVDMASGEEARGSYGGLDPPADAGSVEAGAASIAAHDPEFNPVKLTTWATAATTLICASLTSGDATPARTFMANGLFRTHRALLELRREAEVVCEGSWQAANATVVDVIATPLLDEVRVRITCTGWSWERHAPTGLTLRGGPDPTTWAEDLTFGRSADAASPAAGGLPARHCPSCGAPLDLDDNGACQYCNAVVTAGRHDWVLTSWRRQAW